jgi:hypothetical protein
MSPNFHVKKTYATVERTRQHQLLNVVIEFMCIFVRQTI